MGGVYNGDSFQKLIFLKLALLCWLLFVSLYFILGCLVPSDIFLIINIPLFFLKGYFGGIVYFIQTTLVLYICNNSFIPMLGRNLMVKITSETYSSQKMGLKSSVDVVYVPTSVSDHLCFSWNLMMKGMSL